MLLLVIPGRTRSLANENDLQSVESMPGHMRGFETLLYNLRPVQVTNMQMHGTCNCIRFTTDC